MKKYSPHEILYAGDLIEFKRTFGIYTGDSSVYDSLGIMHEGDFGIVLRESMGEPTYVLTHFGAGFIYRDICDLMRVK